MIIANSNTEADNNEIFWSQQDYLFKLLDESSFIANERQYLLLKIEIENGMSIQRYTELEKLFLENQIDPIIAGRNYNETDIKNKIRREI